jgi:hypothetical protein
MGLTTIRTQIKAIIEDVEGIGIVHDYERWAVDWEKILEFFKPSDQDNSLDDANASEKTFQDLIEGIREKFRTKFDLNGSCESTYLDSTYEGGKVGIQVKMIEMRTFGSVLCHYCELQLGAQERLSY